MKSGGDWLSGRVKSRAVMDEARGDRSAYDFLFLDKTSQKNALDKLWKCNEGLMGPHKALSHIGKLFYSHL